MKYIALIKSVFAIYMTWCLASLCLYYLGVLLPGNELVIKLVDIISIIAFIILASFITMFFMIHIEIHLKQEASIRAVLLLFALLCFLSGYIYVSLTGQKSNIIFCILTANLIFFACIVGNWMTAPVKSPAEIVPVCVVVAFADLFSVFSGPTKYFAENISEYYGKGMQGNPPFVDYLLVKIIVPGQENLMPVFGISDWIIITFLSAVAFKFNMNDNLFNKSIGEMKNSFIFLFLPIAASGLIIAILIARVVNVFIPALPFVVVIFLGFMMMKYPEMRKLTKAEVVPMLVFSCILVVLMIVI